MPFCKKCGLNLEADADFCAACGAPAKKTASTKTPDTDSGKTAVHNRSVYGLLNLENLPAGHIIDDRYEIKEKLGQGGFGAVYLAFDRKMEADKALKVIPEAIVNDLEAMHTLQAEARTMLRLNHPKIVRLYDFHDSGPVKYIDMEYMDGRSLTQVKLAQPDKRIPEDEVKGYARQIAQGMIYAHAQGVIHKDVKPQNILLTEGGQVKIMDFGIAETLHASMTRVAGVSGSGTLVYMSPEQLLGEEVGKESDIYSYGVMLYELLSGNPPFCRGDINYQILNKEPAPVSGISDAMSAFLQKCLMKDYKQRFCDFEEALAALSGAENTVVTPELKEDSGEAAVAEETRRDGEEELETELSSDEAGTVESAPLSPLSQKGWLALRANGEFLKSVGFPKKTRVAAIAGGLSLLLLVFLLSESNRPAIPGMIFVEGGAYEMGSNDGDGDEKPVHTVTVGDFYISKYEVMQKEWREVMGNNPSRFKGDERPVERVTWYDAVEFCNTKSLREGLSPVYTINGSDVTSDFSATGYRLPTEAEWEYAARGGDMGTKRASPYKYSGSDNPGEAGWHTENSGNETHPTGRKKANELGLYDMSGNVWEWCWDWYDGNYYSKSPPGSPSGPARGSRRVLRGGSWIDALNSARAANRFYGYPKDSNFNFGFRLVRYLK